VISRLINSKDFEFIKLEYKLPNNKRMDIALSSKTNKIILVEVLTIFLNPEMINNEKELYRFFDYRFKKKMQEKMEGLSPIDNTIFSFIPVIRTNYEKLTPYREFFNNWPFTPAFQKPMAILQLTDGKDNYKYTLEAIDKIIKDFDRYNNRKYNWFEFILMEIDHYNLSFHLGADVIFRSHREVDRKA